MLISLIHQILQPETSARSQGYFIFLKEYLASLCQRSVTVCKHFFPFPQPFQSNYVPSCHCISNNTVVNTSARAAAAPHLKIQTVVLCVKCWCSDAAEEEFKRCSILLKVSNPIRPVGLVSLILSFDHVLACVRHLQCACSVFCRVSGEWSHYLHSEIKEVCRQDKV